MARAFDLLSDPGESVDYADPYTQPTAPIPPMSRQKSLVNRVRAEDLAARGIPTFRNASGDVAPVTDETGAALNAFDSRNNIAYDSAGQPKKISYGEEGPPIVEDAFARLPTSVNPKTGAVEKEGRGGLYKYLGQDPEVTASLARKERDKELQKESALLGRKLTLDEHDLTVGAKEKKDLREALAGQVLALQDPKFEGADRDTVLKAIDDHFNTEYGAKEANATRGWFGSGELAPEAMTLRADIDKRKADAFEKANRLFDLNDKLTGLHETVEQTRTAERARVETMLAHSQGQPGPLDEQPAAPQTGAGGQLYPPEEDWPRMLGGKDAADALHAEVKKGNIPPAVAPAALAATHDMEDAKKKAEELKDSDPTTAEKYKNFAAAILHGLSSGIGDILRSPLGRGELPGGAAQPLNWGMMAINAAERAVVGKSAGDLAKDAGEALPKATEKLLDERLKDTFATKAGSFIGGIAPYVATAIATRGMSVATPVMMSLFYNSGYQRTLEDAKARGADPVKAEIAATGVGVINAVLALPLKTVGAAAEAVFGSTAPKVIEKAITNAFETGGPAGLKSLLGQLAEQIKKGGAGSEALRKEAVAGIEKVLGITFKTPAERLAIVAKTSAQHAALGAGVQTSENLIKKTYNPDQGTFEGVPESALGFAALGTVSEGFRQVAGARNAKKALDLLQKKAPPTPPAAAAPPALPEGKPPPAGPKPVAPEPRSTSKPVAKEKPAQVTAVETTSKIDNAVVAKAETDYMQKGGHVDRLEAQNKLAELKKQFPNPVDRVMAINEHLAKTEVPAEVDAAAHQAATSPTNDLPEPSGAQKEAGNYQKGHVSVAGLDISIENPAGSKRQPTFAPLQSHYGYIKGTVGADKDHVDIFVKRGTPKDFDGPVYVINQYNKAGNFDEHKAVIGVKTPADARAEYQANYQKGWTGGKSVIEFANAAEFKQWATSGAKGKPAIDPRLPKPIAAVAAKLHLSYGGKGAGGEHQFAVSGERATTIALAKGESAGVLSQKVAKLRESGEGTVDVQKVGKLVQGTMGKHRDLLKSIGHSVTVRPTTGDVTTALGMGVITDEAGKGVIHVDFAKLAKETAEMSERDRARTVQRAVEEEILHVAAVKWEKSAPENGEKIKSWGVEDDELGKFLSKTYSGWDNLTDRQKGHEKLRAVLQKRWTGKLTEAARAVMRELLKFFRGIYEKLTPAQREIVDGVESILKGEEKPPAKVAKATPQVPNETGVKYVLPSFVTGGPKSKLAVRANALYDRLTAVKEIPPTQGTIIMTLLRSGNGKALNQAESKIAKLEGETHATETRKQPKSDKPEHRGDTSQQDVPADKKEVRKGDGAQAGDSGGVEQRKATPTAEVQRVPQPGVLDEKAGAALDAAMEGLFAGKPMPAAKIDMIEQARYLEKQAGQRGMTIASLAINKPDVFNKLAKGWRAQHGPEKIVKTVTKGASGKSYYAQIHAIAALDAVRAGEPAASLVDGFETNKGRFLTRDQAHAEYGRSTTDPSTFTAKNVAKILEESETLAAGKPMAQLAIPADKLAGFVVAAQEMVRLKIDTPEKLAEVLESKFSGKARPFSQALWDAIGMVSPELRGTHDWAQVYGAAAQVKPAQKKVEVPTGWEEYRGKGGRTKVRPIEIPRNAEQLSSVVAARLKDGPLDRRQLTEIATESGLDVKAVDEAAELGVVRAARDLVKEGETPAEKFDNLVELYSRQPNLTAKTSTSKVAQAYSTPAPLAYAASHLADVAGGTRIYEPTAGNGMLLIEADPAKVIANEMNGVRLEALHSQGFKVEANDATKWMPESFVDRVIANPPFGTVLDANQEKKTWPMWDSATDQIDMAIVAKALEAMTDDGRAVLLMGGKNMKDPEERAKAYATEKQANFWNRLYEKYKVVDHFTVDGDLYSKQGAGWPVDVVVIAGRGKSSIQLPSVDGPRILSSWDDIKAELGRTDADRIEAGRYDSERDRQKVGGIIDSIRRVAEPEQRPGPSRDEQPTPARDGGSRSDTSVARSDPEPQPVARRPDPSVVAPAGGERAVGSRADAVQPEQQLGFRVPYKPASTFPSFNIFVPTNMEVPAREALQVLQDRVGGIDKFVREKLGYSDDAPVEKYFSAEQMDALALAIDAIDGKTAFVLGDQGGVGKGRVAAGMIRYALKQGKIPIFLTKDEKLYAAMIEDLHDIGSDDITPVFTNSDIAFADFSGRKWTQGKMTPTMEEITRTAKLPIGSDVLFTTYNQIQADVPKGFRASKAERASMKASHKAPPNGPRMDALNALAPGSIIIADESHLASGDSIRAWRLAPLLAKADGVYYSSATFAKRPDSMGIYSRTSLSHATQSMSDLVSAMKQGGTPLQQVVSATLASDGLYLRRERDFSHAVFRTHINTETADRDKQLADNYTEGLRTILAVSNKMKEAKDYLNKILRREAKQMSIANPPRVETTNFSSKLHNLVSQYLFAIKAESMVRRAVEGVTKGFTNKEGVTAPHKVIIAVQNTMEQPIIALERGGRPLTFTGMLLQYLDSQRELVSGTGASKQITTISDKPNPKFEMYNDKQLQDRLIEPNPEDPENPKINSEALDELFRRIMSGEFKSAAAKIEVLDLADMPVSPIDHIRHALTQVGIKNAEITGRGLGIDEDGLIYKISPAAHSKAAHLRTLDEFNNADVDVIVMNASGSTGISAHASAKFKNQKPRAMIVGQPHLDINEFMQTLWRIDRTGQVHQPYYENLQTAIPAELRPAAILGRKMGLLNANTTSNAESEISSGNAGVDIFNQYGDEVVYNYLKSDPVFTNMLAMVKIMDGENIAPIEEVLALYEEDGQFAAAVTGRAAVLPTAEQEEFWNKVGADYIAKIDYLNELGENELLADTIDLKAETLESKVLTAEVLSQGRKSGFDQESRLEKIKADIGTKPLEVAEILPMMEEMGVKEYDLHQEWQAKANAWREKELVRLSEKVLGWSLEKAGNYEARWREQEEEINAALGLVGVGLHLKTEKGLDGYGAVTSIDFDDEHPLTPSRQIFNIHVNTTKKMIRVPASQMVGIARQAVGDFAKLYESTAERSNQRYMITGNLLAAYLAIRDAAPMAKIVQYTTDQGDLRQGILMPNKFTPGALAKKRVVESASHMRKLLDAGRSLTNSDNAVTIVKPRGDYVMRVPASRTMGGAYWRDSKLASLMEGGEFIERGGGMVGKITAENLPKVFDRLLDLNATLFFTEQDETLAAGKPHKAPGDFYKEDVVPVAQSVGMTAKESLDMLVRLVSPTVGVQMEAHDAMMKMLGKQYQKGYQTDQVLEAWNKVAAKETRPEQIATVDRIKRGEQQPTEEKQDLAKAMRKIDTESYDAAVAAWRAWYAALGRKMADAEAPLKWKEDHYRVLWKKIPGDTDVERSEWIGKSRRPLRGSMGQHKQSTLEDMSEGIAMGGVPYTYNYVENFKRAQADLWKTTTALNTMAFFKNKGQIEFVKGPFPKAPAGMVAVDDAMFKRFFPAESGEGLILGGQWFIEEGAGRLMNNHISFDHIRAVGLGRGLMWIKNATTSLELSVSPFHAMVVSLEAVGSSLGLGLYKLVNRGVMGGNAKVALEGLKEMITSLGAPVTHYSLGKQFRKAMADPEAFFATPEGKKMLKDFPVARRAADAIFTAGYKPPELEQDWKNQSVQVFLDAVDDLKAGTSNNYIGAALRAFPAANEFMMGPLFDVLIPNLKTAQFLKEFQEATLQNERKLKGGILTEAALARQVLGFVEDRFGEVNYDTLFWNRTFKSSMQLLFRSVTWKWGSVRALGGAFYGQGKEFHDAWNEKRAPQLDPKMAWLFGLCLFTAALGTIVSLALGKHTPENLTDLFFPRIDPKDDKVRVSFATYIKDYAHLLHSPKHYLIASMSGWIGRFADMVRNKDYFGVQIRDTDDPVTKQALQVGQYAAASLLPFSIRGYKNLADSDVSLARRMLALVAINPAPRYMSQTPAEIKAEEYWKGKRTEAGVKPEQMEAKREKSRILSRIRHGDDPNISGALAAGTIKSRDIKPLYQRAAMGQLASSVLHMPLEDAEKIFQRATLKERAQLAPIMAKKRANRAKSGRTAFTGF